MFLGILNCNDNNPQTGTEDKNLDSTRTHWSTPGQKLSDLPNSWFFYILLRVVHVPRIISSPPACTPPLGTQRDLSPSQIVAVHTRSTWTGQTPVSYSPPKITTTTTIHLMMINSCRVEEKVAARLRSGDLFGYLIDKAYLVYGADCECYIDRSWGDSAGAGNLNIYINIF